jgi:MarR family transcriptional regulator, lower aerobic nicotinate degradation pathway regulator
MEAPARLAGLPSRLVGQASRHADRLVAAALAEAGMRRHHYAVLAALAEHGPASQADLGRRLWIDRKDLHAVVADLEQADLISRVRDQADRRRNVVALNRAGERALERLDRRVATAQEEFLAPLDAAERRELLALLARLADHHARERR